MREPDIRKAGIVSKWLGLAAEALGPVTLKDGSTVEREIMTWLPKKKVKAYSVRCAPLASAHPLIKHPAPKYLKLRQGCQHPEMDCEALAYDMSSSCLKY